MRFRLWKCARLWARVGAVAALLSALPAAAQNLIANPRFENNPPPAFGNNIGYGIAPSVLGPGQTSNVVKVDGGVNFTTATVVGPGSQSCHRHGRTAALSGHRVRR